MERVADYIIKELHRKGIEHIFLVTGRGILFLTDAVAKEDGVQGISTHHEQGASYAAMAYAQSKNALGACLVSTGCAASNAVTAALCAWQDNIPVVFISGQHMLEETTYFTGLPIRTFGSQEANIVEIVKSITKYAVMITNPEEIAYELEKAMFLALDGRKGPVWIDVPLDVQNMRVESDNLKHFLQPLKNNAENTIQARKITQEILAVIEEINNAERPLILLGGGARLTEEPGLIEQVISKIKVPVVFTPSGADIYGAGNNLSIGAVGSIGGSRAGNFTIQNADYILAIGTRLCSQMTGTDRRTFARDAKITVLDIDPIEHTKPSVKIDRTIIMDAKIFIGKLAEHEKWNTWNDWCEKCLHWKSIFSVKMENFIKEQAIQDVIDLYSFSDILSDKLDNNTTVITDAGFEELIIPSTIRYRNKQRCLFTAAQGAMGYALPAIIGTYFAGKQDIVTVVGDGSIMMNLQELQTIAFHHIPVKIFVINNDMYAVIRKRQTDLFRKRTIGNDESDGVGSPNFKKIAEAFDISYMNIEKLSELTTKLDDVMNMEGTVLCEVMCIPDQKYLHKSYRLNEKRRLVSSPLEDLSPFLDREVLKTEMIINLLE